MALEIERKFLLKDDSWKHEIDETLIISQGYLSNESVTTRIRIVKKGGVQYAFLTIKGETVDITRQEFEYSVPYADAVEMMKLCKDSIVEKHRHICKVGDFNIEIDEFINDNHGLVIAEIELPSYDLNILNSVVLPKWLGEEVKDPKYFNSNLSKTPYKTW